MKLRDDFSSEIASEFDRSLSLASVLLIKFRIDERSKQCFFFSSVGRSLKRTRFGAAVLFRIFGKERPSRGYRETQQLVEVDDRFTANHFTRLFGIRRAEKYYRR